MRRFHYPSLPVPGAAVTLTEEVAHHLRDVLRLDVGAALQLFDGDGHQCSAQVQSLAPEVVVLGTGPVVLAAPEHPLHLLLGLPKGPAGARAVRMATEAGATTIQLVELRRVQVKGDPRPRLERVVQEAARQCGRADVPELPPPVRLEQALAALPSHWDRRVAVPGAARLPPATGPAAVLVGPEGGLTDREVALALEAGFGALGLGAWVLRAESAAGIAVALTAP